jgi:hypothetical protein
MTHLFFEGGNVAGAQKKILEFNQELNQISDMVQFEGLLKVLGSPQSFFQNDLGFKHKECMK